jgi:outer membrane protein OmpA-like peptidoglycan-associated protein
MDRTGRRGRMVAVVLGLGLWSLGCGRAPEPNLSPLAADVTRIQAEAERLGTDSTAAAYLSVSHRRSEAADTDLPADPALARADLEEARAAGMAALTAGVTRRREADAGDCLKRAADARRDWEDAIQMLEQTEKVAGRRARGVTRTVASDVEAADLPEMPPAPLDSVPPAPAVLSSRGSAWRQRAADLGVPAADLVNVWTAALDAAGVPEIEPAVRDRRLRAAAWAVVELAWRCRAEVERQRCLRAAARIERFAEYRDQALWSMVDLERSMKDSARRELEDERARMEDRQTQLYDQLKQFEGRFASIRREARGTVMSLSDILFDFDKAVLRREAELNLAKVAVILEQFPEMHITIEGHTDNVGTEEYNQKLSERRAAAVHDFLVEQGVSADRMETKGYGMSQPVASNDTPEGRQKNRRVDLVIREE